jgi:hypothetical protein
MYYRKDKKPSTKVEGGIGGLFMEKHIINFMTSCDNKLAQFILPQLAAISKNLDKYNINFFLLHDRISEDNINLIKNHVKLWLMNV